MPAPGTKIYLISGKRHARVGDGSAVDPTTITADSVPLFDTAWVGSDGWDCSDWMAFHQALVATYGQASANQKWLNYWNQQSWNARPYNWCEYNSDFYNYFLGVGITVGDSTAAILNTGNTVINDAATTVNNTANTAKDVSSWLPLIAGALVIGGGIYAYKTFIKDAK